MFLTCNNQQFVEWLSIQLTYLTPVLQSNGHRRKSDITSDKNTTFSVSCIAKAPGLTNKRSVYSFAFW